MTYRKLSLESTFFEGSPDKNMEYFQALVVLMPFPAGPVTTSAKAPQAGKFTWDKSRPKSRGWRQRLRKYMITFPLLLLMFRCADRHNLRANAGMFMSTDFSLHKR